MKEIKISKKQIAKLKEYLNGKNSQSANVRASNNSSRASANK